MKTCNRSVLALAAVLVTLAGAGSAHAATFNVTKTADTSDGTCNADCSLREAVVAANSSGEADTINVPAGHYRLTHENGELDVDPDGSLAINGENARNTIVDQDVQGERVFDIDDPAVVEISNITITGGNTRDSAGGAIDIDDGGEGGDARLTLRNTNVSDNHVLEFDDGEVTGRTSDGGAIDNDGELRIENSVLSGNSAIDEAGAIENDDTLTMVNVTLSGNRALGSNQEDSDQEGTSGAFSNDADDLEASETDGVVTALNVTVVNNSADVGGATTVEGEFRSEVEAVTRFKNSIVANNSAREGTNCAADESGALGGRFESQGNNLESADTCGFNASGDQRNTDPRLGPLQDNGGQTDTHALAADSPARNTASNDGCPSTDQRGVTRPQEGTCDIGAYEFVATPAAAPPVRHRTTLARIRRTCVSSARIRVPVRIRATAGVRRVGVFLGSRRLVQTRRSRFVVRVRLRAGTRRTLRIIVRDRAGNRTVFRRSVARCAQRRRAQPRFTG